MLRQARQLLRISQERLAKKTGISVRKISHYERGLRSIPSDNWILLARELGLPHRCPPAPLVEAVEPWQKLSEFFGKAGQRELPQEFQKQVPCSLLQGLAWTQLMHQGAAVEWISPHRLGYAGAPLVDASYQGLGVTPLPCLTWATPQSRFVLWPQVRVRLRDRGYEVDALLLTAGWLGCSWSVLCLEGYQSEWDAHFFNNIGLEVIGVAESWITGRELRPQLERCLNYRPPGSGV